MARPRKPYDQLVFQRPNSRHKDRQSTIVLPAVTPCTFCGRNNPPMLGSPRHEALRICWKCVASATAQLWPDDNEHDADEPITADELP